MADLTDEERQKVALAVDLRPLWTQGRTKTAFIDVLRQLSSQESEEITEILDKVGLFTENGERRTLTPDDNRRIEFARVRQRVFEEELVSYIHSIVEEAAQITGNSDLTDYELRP